MKIEPIWETQEYVKDVDELYALMQRNPILYHCWTMYELGNITREVALMSAIKFLIQQNENMFKKLVEIYTSRPNVDREIK